MINLDNVPGTKVTSEFVAEQVTIEYDGKLDTSNLIMYMMVPEYNYWVSYSYKSTLDVETRHFMVFWRAKSE